MSLGKKFFALLTAFGFSLGAASAQYIPGGGGGGTPGGTNGQIQYNNAGAFGGVTAVPLANGGTGSSNGFGLMTGVQLTTYGAGGGDFGGLSSSSAAIQDMDCTSAGAGNICYQTIPNPGATYAGKNWIFRRIDTVGGVPCKIRLTSGFQFDAGPTDIYMPPGGSVGIYCDGTNWHTMFLVQPPNTIPDQTITAAGTLTLAHYLNRLPYGVNFALVNTTGELGYTAGQVVSMGGITGSTNSGFTAILDTTNLTVRFGSDASTFKIPHATTGVATAITNANWKIRFYAQ